MINSLNENDLEFLQNYIRKHSGINLSSDSIYLLSSRLKDTLQRRNMNSLTELISLLRLMNNSDLLNEVLEAITIHETSFFRGQRIFEDLKNCLLIEYSRRPTTMQHMRVWSVATSSGQEAYSMAMLLSELPARMKKSSFEILATDISQSIIDKARLGIFSNYEVERHISREYLAKYFTRRPDNAWQVNQNIKDKIKFQQHNLLDPCPTSQRFHMILCRNVLIYFDQDTRNRAIMNLRKMLFPNGFLVLGGTEVLHGMNNYFNPILGIEGVYQRTFYEV